MRIQEDRFRTLSRRQTAILSSWPGLQVRILGRATKISPAIDRMRLGCVPMKVTCTWDMVRSAALINKTRKVFFFFFNPGRTLHALHVHEPTALKVKRLGQCALPSKATASSPPGNSKHSRLACTCCSKTFSRKDGLERHIKERFGLVRYECSFCGRHCGREGFVRRTHLQQHLEGFHRIARGAANKQSKLAPATCLTLSTSAACGSSM